MNKKVLLLPAKKWLLAAGGVLVVAGVVVLADHGVARSAATNTAVCKTAAYQTGQPLVLVDDDATASTNDVSLRTEYAQALSGIAAAASNEGAYLVVEAFGATVGSIKTLCATSTRVAGAAPLLVTAQRTALRKALDRVSEQASQTNMGAAGSSIYGALVDGIQQVQLLRAGQPVPARVFVISDGDESDGNGLHLRRLLDARASDQAIANQIIGTLSPPDARGLSIQIEGVGHLGAGRPISTQGVRRMEDIWTRICTATHADRCLVTAEILNNLEGE